MKDESNKIILVNNSKFYNTSIILNVKYKLKCYFIYIYISSFILYLLFASHGFISIDSPLSICLTLRNFTFILFYLLDKVFHIECKKFVMSVVGRQF